MTADIARSQAGEVMALNEEITETDKLIEGRFRRHHNAEVIRSMPGTCVLLGAEFLAAVGGGLGAYASADRRQPSPARFPPCPGTPGR